jgi:hypothetical protein
VESVTQNRRIPFQALWADDTVYERFSSKMKRGLVAQTGGSSINASEGMSRFNSCPREEASVGAVYDRAFFLESTKYARS